MDRWFASSLVWTISGTDDLHVSRQNVCCHVSLHSKVPSSLLDQNRILDHNVRCTKVYLHCSDRKTGQGTGRQGYLSIKSQVIINQIQTRTKEWERKKERIRRDSEPEWERIRRKMRKRIKRERERTRKNKREQIADNNSWQELIKNHKYTCTQV